MKLKSYKTISIVFIIIGLALIVTLLFFLKGMPTGQKIVFAACVAILIGAMGYNIKVISKKEKEGNPENKK